MNLHFKNIGLLKDINLDLSKDLIILCGPNNSGKTFAAYCTYGVYQTANSKVIDIPLLFPETISDLISKGSVNFDLINSLKVAEKKILDSISRSFKRELPNIFATTSEFFTLSDLKIVLSQNEIENKIFKERIELTFKLGGNSLITISKKESNRNVSILLIEEKIDLNQTNIPKDFLVHFIQDRLLEIVIRLIFKNTYISPAERTAINIFSKELSVTRNEIVDRLLQYKNSEKRKIYLNKAQRYPLPIRSSLAIAEDLANLQKNKSDFDYLAVKIEKEILKGKIKVSKEGDILFNPNRSNVKNLGMHISASIVKSLSNLVFYFRHLAKKDDFVIIDEPELNLHPDNQRIIAKVLAVIVNNGFKVMISTHSDYIIREFNNLIMLNSGGKRANELIQKYKYKKEELLDFNTIGVYLFKTNAFSIIDVSETGFEISTIDKEINSINESSQDIFLSLF